MGDPLSAAAAALSLPGIFMSCIQCFNLIQCSSNYERDFLILTTKFSNQQLRFSKWGEACGLGAESSSPCNLYDTRLDHPSLKPNISRTLHSLKLILDDGVDLIQKHNPQNSHIDDISGPEVSLQSGRWSWTLVRERIHRSLSVNRPRGASRWALSDKKALDELVRHLHDLIRDLEIMTAELRIPEQQRVLIQHEMESISDPLVLQIIEESRIGAIDLVSDAAICHLSSIRNINIHTLEPTSLDTASLPNTNRTKDSYQTAAEYTSEVLFTGMGAVSDAADHLPSQNQRVMRELLKQAGPTDSLFKTRVIDSSQVGQLLQSFRLDVRNEKLWEHLRVLELPPLPERLNDDLARRLRSEVKNAEIQVNPDHENKTPSTIQQKHTLPWMTFQSIANQLHLFLGSIEGPHSTPYAGGLFHFLIYVGPNYPFKPPKFLAVTRIYHPNISPTGEICLDLFNDCVWGPAFSIQTALVGIASVLDDAGLDDPLVPEVAEIYLRDRSTYDENVRLYTQQYATPEYLFTDEGLDRCLQMCLRITGKD